VTPCAALPTVTSHTKKLFPQKSSAGQMNGQMNPSGGPLHVLFCFFFFSLPQIGDFYESIGFDTCLVVEYAGLNPMGGKDAAPRAGCPVVNLRQTLTRSRRTASL